MDTLKLYELSKLTPRGTNLAENPRRYSDPASQYSGPVPDRRGKGLVYDDKPLEVYLSDINLANRSAAKTLAHEGTHSKLLSNTQRKALKEGYLPTKLRENILELMSSNPEFLQDYVGDTKGAGYNDLSYDGLSYLTSDDEITARLNAMEALSPKGSTLEKSKYGKQLFGKDNEFLDQYLTAVIPEGYIRNNKPFKQIPNQSQVVAKPILNSIADWISQKMQNKP